MQLSQLKVPQFALNLVSQLIGPQCTRQLLQNYDLSDKACVSLAVSKGLSVGIIGGAVFVKVPQILKVLLSQSVDGLSFLSILLETVATSITFAYNFRAGNPFTTYGETLFMTGQNLLLVLLIGYYGRKSMQLMVLMALYSVFMSSLLVPDYIGSETMNYLQGATIPLAAVSRLPQIAKIWSAGSTGQLSALTVSLICAGSLARVFTTFKEVPDRLLLAGFVVAAALNSVLFLQMLWYWRAAPKSPSKSKKNKFKRH